MRKHPLRIRPVVIYAALMALLLSAVASHPALAHPLAAPLTAPRAQDEGRANRTKDTARSQIEKYKKTMVSYAEPSDLLLGSLAQDRLGATADQNQVDREAARLRSDWRQSHYSGPDPKDYQRLANNEQRALAANSSPLAMGEAVSGTLRLLAIAVEFDGTDSVTNFSHPKSVVDRTCITETLTLSGPLHNQIPAPGPRDNFTFWKPSFEQDYYDKLIFSTEGITERVRMDLRDPEDGKKGIDVSGMTMRNYYEEVSGGRVQFDGGPRGVTAWVKVPHSEAYYGASACTNGEAGDIADMEGLPSNPRFGNGAATLIEDTVKAINAADPSFPWADYDTDGDGLIDHVVLFHAGKDKSDGGGQQQWQALWAHRGEIDPGAGGYTVNDGGTPNDPTDDIKIFHYTMQYEDATVGVLVHEFGHDLGLPDLYNTNRDGESDPEWWDLMDGGELTGKLVGSIPTHMSAWSKFALGWADTQVVSPTMAAEDIALGQTSGPPEGTTQAIRVNLPNSQINYTDLLPGSTQAWWTGNDQDWADVQLARDVDLTGVTAPISISFDLNYIIEQDWDYMFLEVSVDGGLTYTQTKGFDAATGEELTTPDDYPDPNGRLHDYGDLTHGYTGDSGGWVRAYHDLSPFAGKNIKLRFRYATDTAFLERGAFVDNIKITAGSNVLLDDPVEGDNLNGWTPTIGTFSPGTPLGAGWRFSTGTILRPKYYLIEWRTSDGFDKGLLYAYHGILNVLNPNGSVEFRVDRLRSNVPGMLVWLRDTRFGNDPFGANQSIVDPDHFLESPSEGPKGGLLIVDAHPQPLRGPFHSTVNFGFGTYPFPPLDNWSGRVQAVNAAFSLNSTPRLTLSIAHNVASPNRTTYDRTRYAPLPGVRGFHDSLGYFAGVEKLPRPVRTFADNTLLRLKPYAFSDPDGSVVVPARGYYPPRTPAGFTGRGAETTPRSANVSTFETMLLDSDSADPSTFQVVSIGEAGGLDMSGQQTGNPGDYGVQYGHHFLLLAQSPDGASATVRVWNSQIAADVSSSATPSATGDGVVTVNVEAQNVGSPAPLTIYSQFDGRQAAFVDGSATNGAIFVRATQDQVAAAFGRQGMAGVQALAAAPSSATAIVWTSPNKLAAGETASFSYQLKLSPGITSVGTNNQLIGSASAGR